jgi:hypothetical protein
MAWVNATQNSDSSQTPELRLLPDLAGVGAQGLAGVLALQALELAADGLAEADPGARVGLLAHHVVALGRDAHGQHVVRPLGRLRPGRGQRHVAADAFGVLQHLDPRDAVGVGPHGVVDPREVHIDLLVLLAHQVRQQEAHLVVGQGPLARPEQLAPLVDVRRVLLGTGLVLVPAVGVPAAGHAEGAGEHVQEQERAGDLPTAQVASGSVAPQVAGPLVAGRLDLVGQLGHGPGRDLAFVGDEGVGVPGVALLEDLDEALEALTALAELLEALLPVDPGLHEVPVDGVAL